MPGKVIRVGRTIQNKDASSGDVAQLAGVSQTTVSRVFSGKNLVKEETRQRVLRAAKELGYHPNALAGSLNSQKSGLIALLAIDLVNPHLNVLINRFTNEIQKLGYQTLFFLSPREEDLDTSISRILAYRVDAIIILSAAISSQIDNEIRKVDKPVLVFNKYSASRNLFSVCTDNVGAGRLAAEYFIQNGRQSFAFIGSDSISGTTMDRLKGFRDHVEEHTGGKVETAFRPYSYRSGYEAMDQILSQSRPDAVFAVGDLMAAGAIDCVREKYGLKVPEDVAVIGCDNIDEASWGAYAITTLEQDIDGMIVSSVEYLKKALSGQEADGGCTLFPCRMVRRVTA